MLHPVHWPSFTESNTLFALSIMKDSLESILDDALLKALRDLESPIPKDEPFFRYRFSSYCGDEWHYYVYGVLDERVAVLFWSLLSTKIEQHQPDAVFDTNGAVWDVTKSLQRIINEVDFSSVPGTEPRNRDGGSMRLLLTMDKVHVELFWLWENKDGQVEALPFASRSLPPIIGKIKEHKPKLEPVDGAIQQQLDEKVAARRKAFAARCHSACKVSRERREKRLRDQVTAEVKTIRDASFRGALIGASVAFLLAGLGALVLSWFQC